ncbi:unnamed protein product [Diabrotica balteata]|uniref:Deacetylase sirtuin-type domain-containing protein n=1 Tax=Diabrotica balteata TaxID=107213 RepID=A0A9N9T121_DIABA|nr:unnamed protein product [Diabrotica balteata]
MIQVLSSAKVKVKLASVNGGKFNGINLNSSVKLTEGDFSCHQPMDYKQFEQQVMVSSTPIIDPKYDTVSSEDEDDQEEEEKQIEIIFKDQIPSCEKCSGVVKPDIIFFGEVLPSKFYNGIRTDYSKCDLLIIIGTSLAVQPFASLVDRVENHVPRILINREKSGHRSSIMTMLGMGGGLNFDSKDNTRDVCWLGDCDEGCLLFAKKLGWAKKRQPILEVRLDFPKTFANKEMFVPSRPVTPKRIPAKKRQPILKVRLDFPKTFANKEMFVPSRPVTPKKIPAKKRQPILEYHCTSTNGRNLKKSNWFCNKPLSPIKDVLNDGRNNSPVKEMEESLQDRSITSSGDFSVEQLYRENVCRFESEAENSPVDDSINDPNFSPSSEDSDCELNERSSNSTESHDNQNILGITSNVINNIKNLPYDNYGENSKAELKKERIGNKITEDFCYFCGSLVKNFA